MAGRVISSGFKVRKQFNLPSGYEMQWFPGHMRKGLEQINSTLRHIDAVLEVHDARIPFTGRKNQLSDIIQIRPHVLLLNKADLADTSRENEIFQKLNQEGVTNVMYMNSVKKNILNQIENEVIPTLLKDIENKPRYRNDMSSGLNIMVMGIPNVGKSTLLNKLRETYTTKRKCARVGAMPGVTRSVMNRVKVNFDPDMFVVDTPGILNPRIPDMNTGMRLCLCDCVPGHLMEPELVVDYMLFWLNTHKNFSYVEHYGLEGPTDNYMEFLAAIAMKNKFVVKRRENKTSEKYKYFINFTKTAHLVIKDFRLGCFGQMLLDLDQLD